MSNSIENARSLRRARMVKRAGIGATGLLAAQALMGGFNFGRTESVSAGSEPMPTPIVLAGPETTSNPTPTPAATESAESGVQYSPEGHYEKGDRAIVKAGSLIIGDIMAADLGTRYVTEFSRLYDTDTDKASEELDNAQTGLITEAMVDAEVYFRFGGDIVEVDEDKKAEWLQIQANDMFAGGCGPNGCADGVNLVRWTGKDTTVTQSGTLAKDTVNANDGELLKVNGEEPTQLPEMTNPDQIKEYVDANPNMDPAVAQRLLDTLIVNGFDVNAPDNQETLQALIACICKADGSCEQPEPSQTPKPTREPEACPTPFKDKVLEFESDTFKNIYGLIALGDDKIKIDSDHNGRLIDNQWVTYRDNDTNTAAVSRRWFGRPTDVAVNSDVGGTDVIYFLCPDKKAYNDKLDQAIKATLATGRTIDKKSLK